MIKNIPNEVWAFDCEWVPDIEAGRLLYHLPDDLPTQEVLRVMWEQGGATQDNPTPFLRTLLCRIVSVAMVIRRVLPNGTVRLFLQSLPEDPEDPSQDEVYILNRFLKDGLSVHNPQLVGFNSRNSDLRILTQRALIHGLPQPRLCERLSAKPWESQDIDLMDFVSGFGKTYAVSLNELATLAGIPGKLDTSGDDVCGLWYSGQHRKIVSYNCLDALTTYLVWLRMATFSGCLDLTNYRLEQQRVKALLDEHLEKPENAFLLPFLDAWRTLKQRTGELTDGVFSADTQ